MRSRANFTLLTVILLLAGGTLYGQTPLLEEQFNYAAGSLLTANGWTAHSGGGVNPQAVITPGLTYPNYPGSGVGGAVRLISFGEDVNEGLSDSVATGAVYVSCLVRVDTAKTGDYFLHLGPKTISTIFRMRVYVKLAANGNLAFGISKSSVTATNPAKYTDSVYSIGTTYLVVGKYTVIPGDLNDSVSLWINPAIGGTEPAPLISHSDAGTSASDIFPGSVALRQGTLASAPSVVVDGIRVTTSWSNLLPVELASFTALASGNTVTLNWVTASELNNSGFEVQRKLSGGTWVAVGRVQGAGTTTLVQRYRYADDISGITGVVSYRLKQFDFGGAFSYSGIVAVSADMPAEYSLSQNYPNPFNPVTNITFFMPAPGFAAIRLYDVTGREVARIAQGIYSAGSHTVPVDATGLQSGTYFYTFTANNGAFTRTGKMTLLK